MTPILIIAFGALITGDPIGWRVIVRALLAVGGVLIIAIRTSRTLSKWLTVRSLGGQPPAARANATASPIRRRNVSGVGTLPCLAPRAA